MKLSVLIPVYNEEDHIQELLSRVLAVPCTAEVVVVDDCSSDSTWNVLSQVNDPRLRVFRHEVNQGKGAAIRTALGHASSDMVIIQDADLEYDPNDYPKLLEPVLNGQAQVVYGVRDISAQKLLFSLGNKFLSLVTSVLYGAPVADMETCYKLMPRELMLSLDLQPSRFQIEPEITAKLLRRGYRIHEVPIWYQPRETHAKKLSAWRDGLPALWTLIKYRFAGA
ncbi:MAG TPA: glycosyltransferase family 2 protein [Anaerolineae bacterium]|nr:glycosyltransferase family 2 protein [Anaerolineae bacterium]